MTRGVDVDKLPTFDIEYIFLNIRAKSIGEDIKMTVTCPDDGVTQVPGTLYVDEIKVTFPRYVVRLDYRPRFIDHVIISESRGLSQFPRNQCHCIAYV